MRFITWLIISIICGTFGFAIGTGLGLPMAGRWMIALWVVWGVFFAIYIDTPILQSVARTVYKGELDPHGRPIRGRIKAYERGIIRLKDDTSTLQWKTCSLTLIHAVWVVMINLFMVLVVLRHLAMWIGGQN